MSGPTDKGASEVLGTLETQLVQLIFPRLSGKAAKLVGISQSEKYFLPLAHSDWEFINFRRKRGKK